MSETMTVEEQRELLEQALFEIKRVIAGQDAMLERVLVCLLSGGHLLIEGVPGLAKTLTIKTTAQVLGGSFQRVQFTPDLVPSDLVGTRMYRPDSGTFDTELGPVFCNFLLADEINRAPAKVQSALLEVMQEHQVTIGHETHLVPEPFLVMATQNPIESEGTYPLPEAQVDRFMLKILVGYPEHDEELTVVQRSLTAAPQLRQVLELERLRDLQNEAAAVYVDPGIVSYTVQLATATREPPQVRAGRHGALHLLRRQPARPDQPRPVGEGARVHPRPRLRRRAGHRVAGEGCAPAPARAQLPGPRRAGGRRQDPRRGDREGDRAGARPEQAGDRSLTIAPETTEFARRPDRPGPGALPETLLRALDLTIGRRIEGMLAGDHRSSVLGAGSELAQVRPYIPGDDVRRIEWNVTARTGETHVRIDLAERVLVTWLALDVSASMSFGTAERRKADVAEGVALALGHLASRRGNRLGLVGFGDDRVAGHPAARRAAPGCWASCSRCGASPCSKEAGPRRSERRSGSSPGWPGSARWWPSSPTFAGRATGACRCSSSPAAMTCSPSRSATPVRRRCRTSASSASWIPRPGASSASTPRARGCASGSRPPPRRSAPRSRSELTSLGVGPRRALHRGRLAAAVRTPFAPPRRPQVTFQWPLMLLALLLVPLAVGGYLLLERRRHRQAAAFANPALVPNLVGRKPGRLRHVPPALALIALAALATGLARPHAQVSVEREEATVVLAIDTSRSMVATDVPPSRLAVAQRTTRRFLDSLPKGYRVGMVSFAQAASTVLPATANRDAAKRALAALRTGDGTALGEGIARALQVAQRVRVDGTRRPPASILVLSDGAQTQGVLEPLQAARRAKQLKIPVYTVAFGTADGVVEVVDDNGFTQRVSVPPDPPTLRQISQATGGRFYAAPDGARLTAVYDELGSRLGHEKKDREITAAFAATGAFLLLAAGAVSAFFFGRLP